MELRVFVVCYSNGNLHSMTLYQDVAHHTANRIGGIIGELTNVHKPMNINELTGDVARQILQKMEHPEFRSKRTRPDRSTDVDVDDSTPPLDRPEAA